MLMSTVIMWKYSMFLPTPTTSSVLLSYSTDLPLPQSSMDEVALKVDCNREDNGRFVHFNIYCMYMTNHNYCSDIREGWASSQQT